MALHVAVYATDGTREHLVGEGVEVASVGELTSLPSLLGGQVKTFHPAIYAGILARRDRPDELAELADQQIGLLDLVVVNVRPFAPQVGARLVPLEEAVDMIDVGGVALLSAAARNFAGVAAVSNPARYPRGPGGHPDTRRGLGRAQGAACRRRLCRGSRVQRRSRRLPEPRERSPVPRPSHVGP